VNPSDQINFELPRLFSLIEQFNLSFDQFGVQENS
jgi:hypothetical protein